MPIDLTIKVNFDEVIDEMEDVFTKQIPFASMLALNETAFKVTGDLKEAMPFYIQGGPIPFTKRGVQYIKAPDKRNLRASIFIPDAQWKYMQWIVDGGNKKWSQSHHGISVPIQENVKFNKYGNIPGKKRKESLWREILNRKGKGRTATPVKGALNKKQFIATIGDITGLWERTGGRKNKSTKLLMVFTHESIEYRKGRFPFEKLAIKFVNKRFRRTFNKKFQQIIRKESKRLKVK